VTVNNELPVLPQSIQFTNTYTAPKGALNYNGTWTITNTSSATNVLWMSLVEKAYAQWNELGYEQHGWGNDGINGYEPINGGFMQPVYDQVLGLNDNSQTYYLPGTAESVLTNALATPGEVVTIGTIPGLNSEFTPDNLLVEGHAYTVVGYNSKTGLFTLHNPWGNAPQEPPVPPAKTSPPTQPVGLTWAELNADCDQFAIGNTLQSATFMSSIAPATITPTAPKPIKNLNKLYSTIGVPASAASAWYAISNAEASTKKDPVPASTHDLALLAYLG
jgi:hypothetical protein